MTNRSRWIFLHLGAPAPPQHGHIPVHLLLLLLSAAAAAAAAPAAVPDLTTDNPSSSSSSVDYPSLKFDPSIAIVVAVLVFAFFLLGFCSLFVRQCAGLAADGGNSHHYAARARLSVRGLDPKVINSFPVFNYAEIKGLKIGRESLECAVCINEFEDDETLRLLPKCDHVFHPECIDAWLASHSTCPVCRANLTPTSGDTTQQAEPNCLTEHHNSGSEQSEVQNQNQISIRIDEDENRDPPQARSETQKPQNWQRVTKLPRSHSTGHSLVQPGENSERYTLRLPEEVRKQIMIRSLKRTRSFVVFFPAEGSSRRGYRSGPEVGRSDWFGRSDRWVFTRTPPFFARTGPLMSPTCATTPFKSVHLLPV